MYTKYNSLITKKKKTLSTRTHTYDDSLFEQLQLYRYFFRKIINNYVLIDINAYYQYYDVISEHVASSTFLIISNAIHPM